MQSGEDPAGGKDSKSAKPLPWKYIALAAIVAAAILGIFFAATTGIFSGPVADTTIPASSEFTGSGFSPPAETNSGSLAVTDKKDDEKSTKTTRIPNPNEITPYRTIIDISNLPEFIQSYGYKEGLIITDIEINNDKITAAYLNINQEKSIRVKLMRIYFYDAQQYIIYRKQGVCTCGNEIQYKMVNAHCQWPDGYCDLTHSGKSWEEYWEKQSGESAKTKTIGSTAFKDIVPTIESGTKYKFSIECVIPKKTKFIEIM